jgi:hypothetical protein
MSEKERKEILSLLEQARRAAQEYLLCHYGELISVGEPSFDFDKQEYTLPLRYTAAFNLGRQDVLTFVTIEPLGHIALNWKLEPLQEKTTPRNKVLEAFKEVVRRLAK